MVAKFAGELFSGLYSRIVGEEEDQSQLQSATASSSSPTSELADMSKVWQSSFQQMHKAVKHQDSLLSKKINERTEWERRIAPVQQEIEYLHRQRNELAYRIGYLQKSIETLTELSRVATLTPELQEMLRSYFKSPETVHESIIVLKTAYKICLQRALTKMRQELLALLQYTSEPSDSAVSKAIDDKCRAYGLLMSASGLRYIKAPDKITQKSVPKEIPSCIPTEHREILASFSESALDLSWKMVTLLPPAIVCTPAIPFDDELHEPNRIMYDESRSTSPLIYYQPLLMFGTQVGVKAKVANIRTSATSTEGSETPQGISVVQHRDLPAHMVPRTETSRKDESYSEAGSKINCTSCNVQCQENELTTEGICLACVNKMKQQTV